jgi:hypothetical protein
VRTEVRRVVDLALVGSTLRLVLTTEADTGAGLLLVHGTGGTDGEPFRRLPAMDPVALPASVLPRLREALALLEAEARS